MRQFIIASTLALGSIMTSSFGIANPDAVTFLAARHGLAPYLETAGADELGTINLAVLGQLMELDEGYNVKPALLSDAHYDYARNLFVLRLRDGLHFHNGRQATAKDLEFSLVRGFFSPNRSFYRTYIGNIEGIEAAVGKTYASGVVSGVRVVDNLTVEVKLAAPNPTFLASLVNAYFSLVPQEALDSTLLAWKTVPIGVGPYRVGPAGFKDGHVRLEKVGSADHGPATFDLYTSDQLPKYDISNLSAEKVDSPAEHFRERAGAVTTLFFSRLNPLGANPHFRKAVSLLVNRAKLKPGIKGSTSATQLLPKQFWGRTVLHASYDLEAAKAEIAKIPKDFIKRHWHFARFMGTSHSPEQDFLKNELIAQFAAAGLHFSEANITEKFITEKTAQANPLFLKSRITDYIDPLIMFASFRKGGHDPFLSPLDDQEYERLFVAASEAKLHDDRISSVQALSKYVSENVLCVPLLERRYALYYDPSRLKGLGEQSQPNTLIIQNIEY